jgi:hypothetical protein
MACSNFAEYAYYSPAPKRRSTIAQGNALGLIFKKTVSTEGAGQSAALSVLDEMILTEAKAKYSITIEIK